MSGVGEVGMDPSTSGDVRGKATGVDEEAKLPPSEAPDESGAWWMKTERKST